jgi:hypothetical protein
LKHEHPKEIKQRPARNNGPFTWQPCLHCFYHVANLQLAQQLQSILHNAHQNLDKARHHQEFGLLHVTEWVDMLLFISFVFSITD